jgi:hypothetical protein
VLAALEDLAPIGALAFEDAARIMQAVGEDVEIGLAPVHQLAVVPDDTVEPVIRFIHGIFSLGVRPVRWYRIASAQTFKIPDAFKVPDAFASRANTRYVSSAL